ncbi:hypothetical protein ACVWXP_001737 [Bradyrhizobium sp. USDA 4463]
MSASVPSPSRNPIYFETADVIAIRDAIRALVAVILEQRIQLVFGGHPAITPMIRLQINQVGVPVGDRVVMFQSKFYGREFPNDNAAFEKVVLTKGIDNDRDKSLAYMREQMLSGEFRSGFFIGGMEGVEDEYSMFGKMHPKTPRFPIASTGAASARLFQSDSRLQERHPELEREISYLNLMRNLIALRES